MGGYKPGDVNLKAALGCKKITIITLSVVGVLLVALCGWAA